MAAFLPDIRAIILAQFPAETVALYGEPPSPAAVVTLKGFGGPTAMPRFDGTTDDDRRVQIRVRDPLRQTLETRTEALYDYFRGIRRFSQYYMVIESQGAPFYDYPVDANGNSIASFNLLRLQG